MAAELELGGAEASRLAVVRECSVLERMSTSPLLSDVIR